jgi:hypothetical protein
MSDSFLGWWCIWARWHRWRFVCHLSKWSDLFECKRCRRQWALNHDCGIVLPFHTVASFYRRFGKTPDGAA